MGNGPQKFWMVFNSSGRPPKKRHSTLTKAHEEAKRLANANPGMKCYVLEAIGYASTGSQQREGKFGPVETITL